LLLLHADLQYTDRFVDFQGGSILRRKISLLACLTFVAALALVNHGCSGGGSADSDQLTGDLNVDLNDPKIIEKLGEDDGYAFAVFYGGDIHGSLETCG
jgi:hypothetical protein